MRNDELQNEGEIVIYQPDESIRLEVRLEQETVWLSQMQMAELFKVNVPAVNKHVKNIYDEGELVRESTISILEIVRKEGSRTVKRKVEYYNLDVIISVGYRIKSQVGTRFRQWANTIIRHHLLNGYSINRQLVALQERTDERFVKIEHQLDRHQKQLDFFIQTNVPPAESHDRWLIIYDRLYHCGHSLNANGGHKISAITLMGTSMEVVLREVEF